MLAYLRCFGEERILCVANLSETMQAVEIDLSDLAGCIPVDLFGGCLMPAIESGPYTLTLGGHAFYWLKLLSPEEAMSRSDNPLEAMDRPELPAKDQIRGHRPDG